MTETALFHLEDIELMRGQRRTILHERSKFSEWKDRKVIYGFDKQLLALNKKLFELTGEEIYKK